MEYIDACELLKETDAEIHRLNRLKQHIQTYSCPEFSIRQQEIHMENIEKDLAVLEERKVKAYELKREAEEIMDFSPVRIQRIIKYKFFHGMTWQQVADKLGGRGTADSIKKEFQRHFKQSR